VTEQGGPPQRAGGWSARLFGETAAPGPARPDRARPEAPRTVRWAALVAALQAALIGVGALVLLWLTLTGNPESVGRAVAEVVLVALVAGALGAAARGLWRAASWARGPVVALQVFLGLSAFVTAFEAERPLIGVPVLMLVATELYLLATPEARLAFLER
jgi:hypothetical protein